MPMLTEVEGTSKPRSVRAAPSLACDLSWLLTVAARPTMQARYPQLAEMFNGREELADCVQGFWGDGEETCFEEMLILAHHGDATNETDPDALWRTIERAVESIPLELDMPSEDPESRAVFIGRFRRLKDSPELVRSYLDLLREVWAPVNDAWQQALPVMEEAGRHVVAQAERGRSLEALIPTGCDILAARLPSILTDVESGRSDLLFVPCLFFGSSMYLEFPGLIIIGTGVGQGDAAARARTEAVARRLKAVADPTRLALLHSLASSPSSIGELAVMFRLAQPTVSMHIKVLRENGLVQSHRQDGRMLLSADSAAVDALLAEVREAVLQGLEGVGSAQGESTTGSDAIPATVVDTTRSAAPVTA